MVSLIFPAPRPYICQYMRVRLNPRLPLFIIFVVWTTGAASAFTLSVTGSANAQLSAADGYLPKAQLGGEAGLDVLFPVNWWLALGGSAGILGANASDMLGGFGYRSYSRGVSGLCCRGERALASWKYVERCAGAAAGALANVADTEHDPGVLLPQHGP